MSGSVGEPARGRSGSATNVAVELGRLIERVDGMSGRIDQLGEVRDVVLRLVERLETQDTAGQITALRQDVVRAHDLIKTDVQALAARVVALEAERNKVVGWAGITAWIGRQLPWIGLLFAAFAAGGVFKQGSH